MPDLKKIRNQIDETDQKIVELFEKRMSLVEEVAKFKIETGKRVLDTRREAEKLEVLQKEASTEFNRTGITEVFRQMMAISRKRQYQLLMEHGVGELPDFHQVDQVDFKNAKVVFQGVEGAYSFAAMKTFFDDSIQSRHVATWKEALKLVADGQADYAVLPIENSTAGSVSDIYDLMLDYPIYIVGEQVIRIEHKLMAPQGASLETIDRIYSHPQALAQCREFLDKHPDWEREPLLNTAVAAKQVAEENDIRHAAIASETAAEHYGLKILTSEGLAGETNQTRFVIISRENIFEKNANTISICFELPHRCGTLYPILSHFIFNDLNMNKIESRPIMDKPWEYRFFIDFEGNLDEPSVQNALYGIRAEAADLRLLGNYRSDRSI
jgi:chorismate mutase/prephenate dehydratase